MRPPAGPVAAASRQGAEGWFPVVVVFAGAAVAVVWSGGALAAVAAGVSVPPFGAGLAALVALPAHFEDPAAAWPDAAALGSPGPVLYWTCQAGAVAALSVLAGGSYRLWRGLAAPPAGPLGVAADAGFARRRDTRRLHVRKPQPGRITVGRSNGALVACEPQASLAVVGPTGCGKTAGFAIPALLEWKGPVIAVSVKSDLLDATIAHRRTRGTVWVYDPTGMSQQPPAGWSPLAACTTWAGAMRTAAWLMEVSQARVDTVSDGDYWYTQARKSLAPYLYAAATFGASVTDLVMWVDTQEEREVERQLRHTVESVMAGIVLPSVDTAETERDFQRIWGVVEELGRAHLRKAGGDRAALADRPVESWPLDIYEELGDVADEAWQYQQVLEEVRKEHGLLDVRLPIAAARALWGKDARLKGSVFATVENLLAPWAHPGVGHSAQESEVDLDVWTAGDNTIYVVAAPHEQATLRPVLSLLIQQAVRHAYDTANRSGGTLQQPCLVLLDEAGNVAALRDLPLYAATARSHGITLVSVWQDLAQIRHSYRDRAETVLNNHRARLFASGINDTATLEYVSRLVGDEVRVERNVATDLHGGRRSISEHRSYRRAAPVDVLRRIPDGAGVLLYGRELPIHVRLRPWFGDRALKRAARAGNTRWRRTHARLHRRLDEWRTRSVGVPPRSRGDA